MTKPSCEALLKLFSAQPGISGREEIVRDCIANVISSAADTIETDAMGNLLVFRSGRSEAVLMFAAHMDEIGFTVQSISEDGTVDLFPVGFPEASSLPGQQLIIHGSRDRVPGMVISGLLGKQQSGEKPARPLYRMAIGATDKRQAEKSGVEIGAPVTFSPLYTRLLGNRVLGKAFDNRAGVTALVRAFTSLESPPPLSVCAVFSVQEEVGPRGIGPAVRKVQPAAAICVDTASATFFRYPVAAERSLLGKGPIISYHPATTYDLNLAVETVAGNSDIIYQRQARGLPGADALLMQMAGFGAPCVEIDVPLAYYHTPATLLSLGDLEATSELLLKLMVELPTEYGLA